MPELLTPLPTLAIIGLAAYLLGSVPFGLVVSRAMGLGDIRKIGSGNIGATNVLRSGNKPAAAATLLLDGMKGAVAVLIARALAGEDAAQLAGLAAFLGHLFPLYLGFKGGKGVATFYGILFALAWPIGLWAGAIWIAVAAATRLSSFAALMAAAITPVIAFLSLRIDLLVLTSLLAILIFIRHRENIKRLNARTEPKIGQK